MTVELWTLGKTKAPWLKSGIAQFTERLPHLTSFEYVEWPRPKLPKKPSAEQIKSLEQAYLLDKLKPSDQLHLFDEKGKTFTSRGFSEHLEKLQHRGGSRIIFLIGGAFGFGESLYQRATGKIRLSDMTFSHQVVRVMALEQLYRGYSILRGLPYHND
ncbi:MAG: 23S rRNA (pseudouridine(1915)-N(3))-methyltransferase RlmH [Saprospiraceae bacterium]